MTKEPKVEKTLEELETEATEIAQDDAQITENIDRMVGIRTELRKRRRAVEGKMITMHINAKVK